ncbi:MAG: glycoside hydrolase family 95 protein [Bacteroidaceae bacterium]|nr:glycoside hydrolase family 95 protein [Bacteroidaceae bacterium]
MKKTLFVAFSLLVTATLFAAQKKEEPLKLWYDKPAKQWEEALPIGNGRLGAMVYGGIAHEELQLNEETIWTGSPYNNTNPCAKDSLSKIRQLIFEGRNIEAQRICGDAICSKLGNGMAYQTVGSLHLNFDIKGYDAEAATDRADIAGLGKKGTYYRDLNISDAIATTRFKVGGVTYTRETFASFTDDVIIVRLTASKKGRLSFTASYTTPYQQGTYTIKKLLTSNNTTALLSLSGKADDHEGVEGKVRFNSILKTCIKGGEMVSTDSTIVVTKANEAILYISIGTNFKNYKDVSGNEWNMAMMKLTNTYRDYNSAKEAHTAEYQKYFNRVELKLDAKIMADTITKQLVNTDFSHKTTDARVRDFAKTIDPSFAALYFQFGRYLLICSSQPGGQAANLQGIWNYQRYAPWDGKYTTDINVEMNYWPAEPTNLAEMNEPMLQLIKDCAEQGRQTAEMYGCRGWTLHHNTDIWRSTGAVDGPEWGVWPTCNAWFCQHLYDRYLFSLDNSYLREIYPLMKGACQFYIDFLARDPKSNYLVVAPSYSPENTPLVNGKRSHRIVAGAAMDNEMLTDLFCNTIEAAKLLGEDTLFIDSLSNIASELPPIKVGRWGQIQEWLEDYDDPKDDHRHTSHLWALFPGNQINYFDTPELHAAAIKTLEGRGDISTGWSMGWKVCFWARLLDGNHAYKIITAQMTPTKQGHGQAGGTYPNLFDAHPPFQIDGNFGCTAGIAEMLVQSQNGEIHILPALPDVWTEGTVKGLRCRGGFVIDELTWKDGKPTRIAIRSTKGGTIRLRIGNEIKTQETKPNWRYFF